MLRPRNREMKLLETWLVGQPNCATKLAARARDHYASALTVSYSLCPLGRRAEDANYVHHRLRRRPGAPLVPESSDGSCPPAQPGGSPDHKCNL